jgi:dienelactone hydrolase
MAAVAKAKVPMLFLYGGADPWVPVAKSVERLQALERETHRIEFAVIANADHEMMFPQRTKGWKSNQKRAPLVRHKPLGTSSNSARGSVGMFCQARSKDDESAAVRLSLA